MGRLSTVEPEQAGPELKPVYDDFLRERGAVPNMFKTLGHRPEILKQITAAFRAIMNTGTVPLTIKEMVAVVVSRTNRSEYCNASHTMLSERLGIPRSTLDLLPTPEKAPIAERERAAVEFALAMTRDSVHVPEELFVRLRKHYSEAEIVEIGCVTGIFNFFNRFNNALQMDLTSYGCATAAPNPA